MPFISTRLVLFQLLTVVLAAAEAPAPLMVSAARMKPDDPWLEYPTRDLGRLTGYVTHHDGELSIYGGLKSRTRPATGFFRTEKIDARWWLIDPEGHPFINVGVVDVHIQPGSAAVNENLRARFGTTAAWAAATTEFLRAHGFNGTGAWSDDAVLRAVPRPVAYTRIWNFMSAYGQRRGGTYQQPGHTGYPKDCIFVFDPEFEPFCDDYAKQLESTKDDPWLLGHFSDNELPFYRRSLDNFLSLPAGDAGRKAAENWLAEWRTAHPETKTITDEMRQAFLGFVTERYLRITTTAIRKHDPHHLCLGPRFTGQALESSALFAACARYLDVIAVNYYHAWTPDPALMKRWTEASERPFLVTEWYAKAMDSGYANTTGAGFLVKTQRDRALYYQNFTLGLLKSGACVGWHWFKYMDNDPADLTVDPSNRDSNKGIVTLKFEPYAPLVDGMTELNQQVYSLVEFFDQRAK